jgi:hypothetical protein
MSEGGRYIEPCQGAAAIPGTAARANPAACDFSRFAVREWTANIFSEEKVGADATQTTVINIYSAKFLSACRIN